MISIFFEFLLSWIDQLLEGHYSGNPFPFNSIVVYPTGIYLDIGFNFE